MSDTFMPFDIAGHHEFDQWIAPLRDFGFRSAICLDHEAIPEALEVYLPRQGTPSFHLVRTRDGVVLDDFDVGVAVSFATMANALAEVSGRLAGVRQVSA